MPTGAEEPLSRHRFFIFILFLFRVVESPCLVLHRFSGRFGIKDTNKRFETYVMHLSTTFTIYLIMSSFLGLPRLTTSYLLINPVHLLLPSGTCMLVLQLIPFLGTSVNAMFSLLLQGRSVTQNQILMSTPCLLRLMTSFAGTVSRGSLGKRV
ncbi:hypothetical protein EDD85DRAFT_871738 [Armillaria nabsnona]|nr:hypothetical protein EDD85DRAFT_871738 [Armillaria nabsnona]